MPLSDGRIPERSWAEIDLDALEHNLLEIGQFSGNRALLILVKADGYGHGAVPIARTAVAAGAALLGVADLAEGIELREGGVEAPVLVLGPVLPEEVEPALQHSLQLSLSPALNLPLTVECAKKLDTRAELHLMVDTGMNRNGITPEQALEAARFIARNDFLELVGIATHFVEAETAGSAISDAQLRTFEQVLAAFETEDLLPKFVHAANSAAVLGLPQSYFNLVRPGLATYGMYPSERFRQAASLRPVMSVRAKVTLLRAVPAGAAVGYGATFRFPKATLLASVPVGYADGWPTSLSSCAPALVRGQRAPVVGRVSMDCMMVDVGRIQGVRVGDAVTLLGRDGDYEIRAEELADLSGRIPYEVTCGIGRRIRRKYVKTQCTRSEQPSANNRSTLSRASSRSRLPSA